MDAAGDGILFSSVETAAENGTHNEVSISLTGETMTQIVSDPCLITVIVDKTTTEDTPAIGGNEVHPLTMTQEELQSWIETAEATALGQAFSLVGYLPESVMSYVMTLMMGSAE